MEQINFLFSNTIALRVLLGVTIISSTAAIVGTFSFLRKKALIGDAIAHSLFPGICIGYMLIGSKDPVFIMIGAFVSGWISVWLIDYISASTKLSEDSSIALVSTFFFAIGSVLLSVISNDTSGNQSGLKDFLFGKAATMTNYDITVFILLSIFILIIMLIYFRSFELLSFNKDYAQTIGFNVKKIEFILSSITVLTVSIGIQSVGIVLTSALLIAPAAAARYWTNKLPIMLLVAVVFGIFSSIGGVFISLANENMPTGPWVIFVLFVFTILTFLFSPKKGWFSTRRKQKNNKDKISEENLLKLFYQSFEKGIDQLSYSTILDKRLIDTIELSKTIKKLKEKKYIESVNDSNYKLTDIGKVEAIRIVRLHRLWELYLTKRMNFKDDHIHGTAETIEHLITPEIEEELKIELNFPSTDPHNKNIPY